MSVIWITGASSGIGRACACRYAASGARLVLTSSSKEKLEKVACECVAAGSPDVKVLPYDFSDPEGVEDLAEAAWSAFGCIDTAFFNAGISQRTTVEDTSMEMARKIMEIDFFAPVAAAKALVPKMVAAGSGSIAVTSSIAGLFGFPLRCAYSSAKHALYGYFETLRAEYYEKGIRVTIVCPGRVRTDISLNALDKGGAKYGKMDPGQAGGIDPDKAALKIIKAVSRGRREVLVGGKELAMAYIKRFFPGLCAFVGRKISPV
jgi:Short-chain dehydrogenases of various substrate specificities